MTITVSSRYAVSLALAAAVAVAGCTSTSPSGGTPPTTSTTSSPSTSTSAPTPSPTATTRTTATATATATEVATPDPNIPPEAREKTIAGAQEFTRHFLQVLNAASRAPDPLKLPPLYLSTCKACVSLNQSIQEYKEKGTRLSDDIFGIRNVTTASLIGENAEVLVDMTQNDVRLIDAAGVPLKTVTPRTGSLYFSLRYGPGWRVADLQVSQ